MSLFWILVATMILVALLFLVPPLLRGPRRSAAPSHDALNKALYQHRMQELRADLAAGSLDEAQLAQAETDLKRELLADLAVPDRAPAPAERSRLHDFLAAGVVTLAVPGLALAMYFNLGEGLRGDPSAVLVSGASEQGPDGLPPLDDMVKRLAARLRQAPDDMQGWVMLGRSYLIVKRYEQAAGAYANAYLLGGEGDPEVLLNYAEAVMMANDQNMAGPPAALVDKALALAPNLPRALWYVGLTAYQRQDFARAASVWQQLQRGSPAAGEGAQLLAGYIQDALQKAAASADQPLATATAAAEPVAAADDAGTTIQVSVALDPALQDRVADGDVVYVFARAAQGPRMPLAIVRKSAGELPFTVALTDAMAMTPEMKLSSFPQVVVTARISKSGDAAAQSGDLTADGVPVDTAAGADVQITIDGTVP